MAIRDSLVRLIPRRLRPDTPIVPVVRLSGTIGRRHPAASRPDDLDRGACARSRLCGARRARRCAADQFPGRLAVAIASDLPAHPSIGGGEKAAGLCLHRGRRRIRRLHARLRRETKSSATLIRSLARSASSAARSASSSDAQAWSRAPRLYVGRAQGDARSVPAGEAGRRRPHSQRSRPTSTRTSSSW